MSKKQKPIKRHFPWLFLSLLLIFCLWLTYLWGVFYIPSLPRAEIPPFLLTQTETAPPAEQNPASVTDDTALSPVTAEPDSVGDTETPSSPALPVGITAAETCIPTPADSDIYARRSGVYNILCAGRDDAAFNTDVLILVSFDTDNGTAAVVQIPRDTYLDGGKINALWAKKRTAAKKNASPNADADAMDALCDTLEETLCIRIDHWVLCGLTAFREAVDALGGVTVDVPCDMHYDDPAQNLSIHLSAGKQNLNGVQAEGLVRFRADYVRGDLGRVDVQKLFLSALLEKGRDVSLLQLPSLIKTAAKHLSTGMSFSDLLFFAKSAQKLDLSRVTFLTLPGTDCREYGDSGAWYYVLSREGVWNVVNRHLNVYQTPIDAKLFDRGYRLTNPSSKAMLTYYKTPLTADTATAENLNTDGVHVAVIP